MQTIKKTTGNYHMIYQPLLFIIGTFAITWCCAGCMSKVDYHAHTILFTFLDFMENASPLFCALILLRPYWSKHKFLHHFFLGKPADEYACPIVFLLFAAQFLNFYLFRVEGTTFSLSTFAVTFMGQFLLGGGLEEAGWRGYLLPCLYQKHPILLSSASVSIVWIFWHLPYFLIPGSVQAGGSFFSYSIIGIVTGFLLTAIYLLTKSVLLCMLFHSWQNTIVMTIQANQSDFRFMLIFIFLGVLSVLLCMNIQKKEHTSNHTSST